MGLSSFMSNGLFLMFSVTMTRFETVGIHISSQMGEFSQPEPFFPVFQQGKGKSGSVAFPKNCCQGIHLIRSR